MASVIARFIGVRKVCTNETNITELINLTTSNKFDLVPLFKRTFYKRVSHVQTKFQFIFRQYHFSLHCFPGKEFTEFVLIAFFLR